MSFKGISLSLLMAFVVMATVTDAMFGRVGGLSETLPATPEVQALVEGVKSEVESQEAHFTTFTATQYRYQVVSGINYFVKVDVGGGNFIHMRVYVPLPHTGQPNSLVSYHTGHTATSSIEYF